MQSFSRWLDCNTKLQQFIQINGSQTVTWLTKSDKTDNQISTNDTTNTNENSAKKPM